MPNVTPIFIHNTSEDLLIKLFTLFTNMHMTIQKRNRERLLPFPTSDASDPPWIMLMMMIILVCKQIMAY